MATETETTLTINTFNVGVLGKPLVGTEFDTPTVVTPIPIDLAESGCWSDAKELFWNDLRDKTSDDNILSFLRKRDKLHSLIEATETLKEKADKKYSDRVGSFMGVLLEAKATGDSLLTCAPETISIAWSVVSILITRYIQAVNIGDGGIRRQTLNSTTEVLRQLLHFLWHADRKIIEKKDKDKNVFDKVKKVAKRTEAFFKDIFDDRIRKKFNELMDGYAKLEQANNLAFRDIVMDFLREARERSAEEEDLIQKRLFPSVEETRVLALEMAQAVQKLTSVIATEVNPQLKEINAGVKKLENIATQIKESTDMWKEEMNERNQPNPKKEIEIYYGSLKSTNTHKEQLSLTLEPVKNRENSFGNWLFSSHQYRSWKHNLSSKAYRVQIRAGNRDSRKGSPARQPIEGPEYRPDYIGELATLEGTPSAPFLYIRGQAGFGKSVLMALAVKKLQDEKAKTPQANRDGKAPQNNDQNAQGAPERRNSNNPTLTQKEKEAKPMILFFFFKKGDNSTQLDTVATASLLAQLVRPKNVKSQKDAKKLWAAIEEVKKLEETGKKIPRGDESESEDPRELNHLEEKRDIVKANIEKIKTFAEALGRPVYIIIDGFDECDDFETSNLVPELLELTKSNPRQFRILLSSRDSREVSEHFGETKEPDQGSTGAAVSGGEVAKKSKTDFECSYRANGTIITVSEKTNSEDMTIFLDTRLRELMSRRLPKFFRRDKASKDGGTLEIRSSRPGSSAEKKLKESIDYIAREIQKKSKGMFTYSAMTVANLDQPSEMDLSERIHQLPDGMPLLYFSQLDALTHAERKLVTLALKRIVFGPSDALINTIEIVEQFKRVYTSVRKAGPANPVGYIAGYSDVSIDHVVHEETNQNAKTVSTEDTMESTVEINAGESEATKSSGPKNKRPDLWARRSSFMNEDPIEKEMRNPEVADIIYHLGNKGRDFFKFTNGKRNIELIHMSIREWVVDEAHRQEKAPPIENPFRIDRESDELRLVLSIPSK
ncbi:hypothetical protein ABW19_dt0209977 [Dactylella cylindrospora]|nr:hypothetical protein ABW19_dt0209977 [Dactylella cylindrospora]